jgi:hypothetical protein
MTGAGSMSAAEARTPSSMQAATEARSTDFMYASAAIQQFAARMEIRCGRVALSTAIPLRRFPAHLNYSVCGIFATGNFIQVIEITMDCELTRDTPNLAYP